MLIKHDNEGRKGTSVVAAEIAIKKPFAESDNESSMVVRNPAPDASPTRVPDHSRTFTIVSG